MQLKGVILRRGSFQIYFSGYKSRSWCSPVVNMSGLDTEYEYINVRVVISIEFDYLN